MARARARSQLVTLASSLVVVVVALGCSKPEADKRLMYGSSKDIESFLRDNRADVKLADCDNVRLSGNVTRAFSCTTHIDGEPLRSLISRLEISKDQPDSGSGKEGRCEWRPGFAAHVPGVEIWRANWSCDEKKRPFSFLEVRVASGGAACVEVVPSGC